MRPIPPLSLTLAALLSCTALTELRAAEKNAEAAGTTIITLAGSLDLRPRPNLFGGHEESLHEATITLRKVLRGPVQHVVIDLSQGYSAGLATAEELASVIRAERGTTRTITCLVDGVEDNALVLAAACDETVMANAGIIDVNGVSMESYYFADALAKVGMRFHAVASGEHKTAHEPFTRNAPSPAGAAEFTALAQDLDAILITQSLRPGLTRDQLLAARARAPQTPDLARELKLVNATAEPGAWLAKLPEPIHHTDDDQSGADLSGMAGMMALWQKLLQGDDGPSYAEAVAVIELEGEIIGGGDSSPGESIGPDDTCEMLADLATNKKIKAVVLRINSPGGDAGASDRIHHAVRRLAAVKPVVALFDGVAASGGYYIGCAADEILVHHATITGSIGVFALLPDASGAMEMMGIHRFAVSTGARGDVMSLTAPFTPEREAALRQVVDDVDQRFQGLVAERRHIELTKMPALAGGRVYTGEQAVANGLADGFGTLASAVAAARKRASIEQTLPLERFPKERGLLSRLGLGGVHVLLPATAVRLQRFAAQRGLRVLAWAPLPFK